jgi:TPR repeat protein
MKTRLMVAIACLCLSASPMPAAAADPTAYGSDLLGLADKGDERALAKLLELAEGGHAQAQYDLGSHYLHTIQNMDEGIPRVISWMKKAAEQGVSKAQIDLGVSLNMPGKPWYDPVQALKWFNVGMALTLKEHPEGSLDHYAVFAGNNAFEVGKQLSKEQTREAESLSRAWLDAHGVNAAEEGRNLGAFLERYKSRKK